MFMLSVFECLFEFWAKKIPPAFKKQLCSRKCDFSTACVNKKDFLKEKPKFLLSCSWCSCTFPACVGGEHWAHCRSTVNYTLLLQLLPVWRKLQEGHPFASYVLEGADISSSAQAWRYLMLPSWLEKGNAVIWDLVGSVVEELGFCL